MNSVPVQIASKVKSAYVVAWKATADNKITLKCGDRFVAGSVRLNDYKNLPNKTLLCKLGFQFKNQMKDDHYKYLNKDELDFLPQKLTKLIKYSNNKDKIQVPSPGKMAQRCTLDTYGKQIGASEGYVLENQQAAQNFAYIVDKLYTDYPDLLKDLKEGKKAPEFIVEDEISYMQWVDLALRDPNLAYVRLQGLEKVGAPLKPFTNLANQTIAKAFDEWKFSESRKVEEDFKDAGLTSTDNTSKTLGEMLDIFDYPPLDSQAAYNEVRDLLKNLEPENKSKI